MANKIKFVLLTPIEKIIEKEVESVVVPQIDGYHSIMNGHYPMMSALTKGNMKIIDGAEVENYEISSGFIRTNGKYVVITTRDKLNKQ